MQEQENTPGAGVVNAITVDAEEYFQVSAFNDQIGRHEWDDLPTRLPANVERILDLFEAANVRGTFFTLGWVAERFPETIRCIVARGHELASHGTDHQRVSDLGEDGFRQDVDRARKILEDVSGTRVVGYRAPSFSISGFTPWAHDVLARAGYRYSSSVYPIAHDHYGMPDAPRFPYRRDASGLLEIPLSTVRQFGRNWPCAGGGYFRLLPLRYSEWAVRRINEKEHKPAVFYFHPWELDPDQPRVTGVPLKSRFRHYLNLDKFERRLKYMLTAFRWGRIDEIYLESA